MDSVEGLFEMLDHINLETFLRSFSEHLIETFPSIHGVSILLLAEDNSTLICKGICLPGNLKRIENSYLGFSFGNVEEGRVSSEVFRTKKPTIVNRDRTDSLADWGIMQIFAVPLLNNNKCFGLVTAFSQTGDVEPMDQIENMIETNQGWIYDLYQSDLLQVKSDEIEFHFKDNLEFTERSLRISKITTTDEFLDTVTTEFLDWLEFDFVVVLYRDLNSLIPMAYKYKTPDLQGRCEQWITHMKQKPYTMDLKSGVGPGSLIRRSHFYIEDSRSVYNSVMKLEMSENDRLAFEILDYPYSAMHVPLFSDDTPLGLLELLALSKPVKLTSQQINAINSMATFVSNSIMNARAFDQITIGRLEAEKELNELEQLTLEQIEASNRKAVVDDANTRDMVARVSHELRTPIHGILGMTNLLLQHEMTSKQNSFLKQIRQSGISLERLVNDLLDKAIIETGRLDLESIRFSWSDIYAELKTNLTAAVENNGRYKSVEIVFTHPQSAPDTMLGDPKRITQIFTNLLSNALKFTENGEVMSRVEVKECKDDNIVLSCFVKDTGIGMTEEQCSKLFQDFVQADSSVSRKFGGTGLGLVIARNLVNLMGGDIQVVSEVGMGTCFSFELKLLPDKQNQSWIEYRKSKTVKNRNIAWIDQSPIRTRCVSDYLPKLGFEVDIYNELNVISSALYDPRLSRIVLDMRLVTEQEGWKEWLDQKRNDPNFLEKVILMGYPVELCNLLIIEHLSVIEKPVYMKNVVETLEPLIIDDQKESQKSVEQFNFEKLRILIVDDNKINLQIAAGVLKPTGSRVAFANNGRDAVELTQKLHVDLILMDMQMPVMDGLTATKEIKNLSPEIPVIIVTANLGAKYFQQSLDAGAVDCVTKPFDALELLKKIRDYTKCEG